MLITKKPRTLSKKERDYLVKLVKRGIFPEQYRKHMWLRASGAAAMMNLPQNQSYYKNLKQIGLDYPSPSTNQIEVDLRRTFADLQMENYERSIE
jgi:hypothetical protein